MCTFFHIKAKNDAVIVGRAIDFGIPLNPAFYIHKRGDSLSSSISVDGESIDMPELDIGKSLYGYVGVGVTYKFIPFTNRIITDGMNEAGLNASMLFIENTKYQHFVNPKTSIPAFIMCNWVLGHCGNVQEAREKLPHHQFYMPALMASDLPLYMSLVDKTGESIVVQFQDGEMKIHENPIGLSTNGPWFPWHLDNISNYANITKDTPEPFKMNDFEVKPKDGTGLLGIPGDFTSVSRFVRVAYEKHFLAQPTDNDQAYEQATHILNSVDFGSGVKHGGREDLNTYIFTRWATIKDLDKGIIAIRTHNNMQLRAIDLSKIDFGAIKNHIVHIPNLEPMTFIKNSVSDKFENETGC
ncbi:linear amide C-N hydrolase [Yersinia enterocolitica]